MKLSAIRLVSRSTLALVAAAALIPWSLHAGADERTSIADHRPVASDYLQAIEHLEREYGPYHSDLAQHLASLGSDYRNRGQLEEALDAFERAMHLSRINEGLYSLSQVPILEQLIETNVAARDWESASANHHYLYWLHRRNYDSDDPRILPTLQRLSKWHLNAFMLGFDGGMFHHLVNAHNLYSSAADIIANAYGSHDLRLVEVLRGLTASNYYLAAYQNYSKPSGGFEASFGSSSSQNDEQLRLEQYILRSFSNGKQALTRIHEVYRENPAAPPGSDLRSQVALADWHMLFNRPHSAMELYRKTLAEIETREQVGVAEDDLFGQPVELPDLSDVELSKPSGDDGDEFVVVEFDVTASGRARNINIVESFPEGKVRNRSRVRNSLKIAKFRPRFQNGEPVATENLRRRYVFAD